jgi:hypothetical protein
MVHSSLARTCTGHDNAVSILCETEPFGHAAIGQNKNGGISFRRVSEQLRRGEGYDHS